MIHDFRSSSPLKTQIVLLRMVRLPATQNCTNLQRDWWTWCLTPHVKQHPNLFWSAIEDVEFIQEYISEAAYNHSIVGGLSDLDAIAATLDWQACGKLPRDTTATAGLGYCNDREDCCVDQFMSLLDNQPFQGNKDADMALIDTASNILPWIVDCCSVPSRWWKPNLPKNNPARYLRLDIILAVIWLISFLLLSLPNKGFRSSQSRTLTWQFQASVWSQPLPLYTSWALFKGFQYQDTYVATTGIDITVSAVSPSLDVLQDNLTPGSFGFRIQCYHYLTGSH
jgi:hypothetical protein